MVAFSPPLTDPAPLPASDWDCAQDGDGPVIDLTHLAAQTFGDQALEVELLAMFERQSARIAARLSASHGRDVKSCGDLAHTLKGSALAIGAGEVARAAQAYESHCAAGRPRGEAADAALDRLVEAVARARAAIAGLLG